MPSCVFDLVMPDKDEESGIDMNIRRIVETRIKRLYAAWTTATGWRDIVDGKKDELERCTHNDVHWIKIKAQCVAVALQIALKEMPKMSWDKCCSSAI